MIQCKSLLSWQRQETKVLGIQSIVSLDVLRMLWIVFKQIAMEMWEFLELLDSGDSWMTINERAILRSVVR